MSLSLSPVFCGTFATLGLTILFRDAQIGFWRFMLLIAISAAVSVGVDGGDHGPLQIGVLSLSTSVSEAMRIALDALKELTSSSSVT